MTVATNVEIKPFTIQVPQAELDDLQHRLERTRFANELPDVGDAYGVPGSYVREMVEYWKSDYDWRKWETRLNSYPQFTTEIDGQYIHFLHVRSQEPDAMPLVLLHGWPSSIVDFLHIIEPLTDPVAHGGNASDAFHLVIPSLPGFGFSGPTRDRGWDTRRTSQAIAELMCRLGYERYGTQGGDWGAFLATDLGRIDGDRVIGIHVNAATYGFIPLGELDQAELESLTDGERACLERMQHWGTELNGYFHIQAMRPQTVAYVLSDSPVGQLAWIGDMFYNVPIDRDHVLTDVTLYWLTNTAASSARIYYENMHSSDWPAPSTVPTGVANFSEDIAIRRYAEQANNIVHWTEFDTGGHFAAMEVPDLLACDVQTFFRNLR